MQYRDEVLRWTGCEVVGNRNKYFGVSQQMGQ